MKIWDHIQRGDDAECWEWTRGRNAYGYGVVRHEGKTRIVTRLVWEDVHGEPPGDLCVCHTCDNRGCCNPAHLFLGTRAENIRDMHQKGRYVRGNLKLSDRDARKLLSMTEASAAELAARFGVSKSLVFKLRKDKRDHGKIRGRDAA